MVLLKIYFFSEFFFLTIVNASKWHTGITCSIGQKNVTHVWKIHEKPLKFGYFHNFEGLKVEKVFFTRAKIKPWLYFWLNLLSHNWVFEPMCHAQKHLQKEDHEDQWQAKGGCLLCSPASGVLRLYQSLWGEVQGQEEGDGYLHQCWSSSYSCDQASSSQETEEDKALLMVFLMRIIVIFPL